MDQKLISILIFFISAHFASPEVCNSIEINNEVDLHKLQACTIVVGHVKLANMHFESPAVYMSQIEEITDYLLVYRMDELTTLEKVFPKLTIIRGNKLLFDKYALVVHENRNLRDLGLKSLLKITKGSIRIESNPVLCFTNTINWVHLVEDSMNQHYSLKNNKDPNECPICPSITSVSGNEFLQKNCWNSNNFQRKKPLTYYDNCPSACGGYGCEKTGQCCSSLCLTGCTAENCNICKYYKNLHGDCVEFCSLPNYALFEKCIPENECRSKEWIPHAGACIQECPRSYQESKEDDRYSCTLNCRHNYTIRSKDDLPPLKECVIVKGSVTIELRDDKSITVTDLEDALGGIKEIEGYLKIYKSPQIVSLGFFNTLNTIKGEELIDGEYSLFIVENHHLEDIWPGNHKVALLNGRLFVHLNPRLCYEKIMQLAPTIKTGAEIRVKDVSYNSNGDRVNCGNKIVTIYPEVETVNATAARIKIQPVSSSYKDLIIGYLHFYKVAPYRNVTLFDGMHGCGRDNWQMDMSLDVNIRHILKNLKPYTQYAFFIRTLSHVEDSRGTTWQSDIHYFKTLAMKPGPVTKLYASALSTKEIMVHWWPPRNPNGLITRYVLRYEKARGQTNYTRLSGYSGTDRSSSCECAFESNKRVPHPNETHFYNRQQHYVEAALTNILYISITQIQRWEEELRREDNTRKRRDTKEFSNGQTANKLDITENEDKMTNEDLEGQERLRQYQMEVERLSLAEQDTGDADFQLIPPIPVCGIPYPTETYQRVNNCTATEYYEGKVLPSTNYTYILEGLRPKTVYEIYVRACGNLKENACGPETSVLAETVSEEVEQFLKEP